MKKDFFAIYDALTAGMDESGGRIRAAAGYSRWSLAETDRRLGIAMTTEGDSVPPLFPAGFEGLFLKEAAEAAKSWNFVEAGMGLAAANAWYNTEERMERLGCYLPFETFYTAGLDFRGKTVGLIGHLHGPEEMYSQSAAVHIMEKHPHPGDYPDSACEYLLPRCDIVLIRWLPAPQRPCVPHFWSLGSTGSRASSSRIRTECAPTPPRRGTAHPIPSGSPLCWQNKGFPLSFRAFLLSSRAGQRIFSMFL